MDRGKHTRKTLTLSHSRVFNPEDWLRFIELEIFTDDGDDLGLGDSDLLELQLGIMAGPTLHPVIAGTGGLRKIRFVPEGWHMGKRGAARACYAYYPGHSIVLLVAAYGKSEKEDITAAERKMIKRLLGEFGQALERGIDRSGGGSGRR
jgi:hypothetical protein